MCIFAITSTLFLNVAGIKKTITILVYAFSITFACAQDRVDYKAARLKHTITIAPVVSMYKNHPQHTIDTKAKPGFNASYRGEVRLERRSSILFGLDYFSQGFTFRGYFVAPGYTYLFDKTFAYTHEIRVQELHLPIGFKKAFNNEKDNFYTPYFYGGGGLRYLLSSYYVINNDSTETVVYDGKGAMDYEYQVFTKLLNGKGASFTKKLNTYLYAGLGIQRNLRESGKALFFDISYKYGISRMHYAGHNNSNNLNIKDSHLLFSVGYKF